MSPRVSFAACRAAVPATDLPLCDAESVLWAEAKRGARGGCEGLFREPLHERLAGGARNGALGERPGGGKAGGRIVATGTLEEIKPNPKSVTARYF